MKDVIIFILIMVAILAQWAALIYRACKKFKEITVHFYYKDFKHQYKVIRKIVVKNRMLIVSSNKFVEVYRENKTLFGLRYCELTDKSDDGTHIYSPILIHGGDHISILVLEEDTNVTICYAFDGKPLINHTCEEREMNKNV